MNFSQALQTLLPKRFRGARPDPAPVEAGNVGLGDAALAGTSFVEQEPALSQELHLTSQDISGWAAGGSSLSD